MFHVDQAIAIWRQKMLSAGMESSVSLDELESHLRDVIDEQHAHGLNLEQSFQVAMAQIGSATAITAEFKKVRNMNKPKREKIIYAIRALGFTAFAAMSVYGLFAGRIGASVGERLLGLSAVALTGILIVASAHAWRVLPVIAVKSLRMTVAVAIVLLGAVTTALVFDVVMPKYDLTLAQIVVKVLWALQPLTLGGVISAGLVEAADRRLTSATSN